MHVKGCMWYCKASAAGSGNMRRLSACPACRRRRLRVRACMLLCVSNGFPAKRDLLNVHVEVSNARQWEDWLLEFSRGLGLAKLNVQFRSNYRDMPACVYVIVGRVIG